MFLKPVKLLLSLLLPSLVFAQTSPSNIGTSDPLEFLYNSQGYVDGVSGMTYTPSIGTSVIDIDDLEWNFSDVPITEESTVAGVSVTREIYRNENLTGSSDEIAVSEYYANNLSGGKTMFTRVVQGVGYGVAGVEIGYTAFEVQDFGLGMAEMMVFFGGDTIYKSINFRTDQYFATNTSLAVGIDQYAFRYDLNNTPTLGKALTNYGVKFTGNGYQFEGVAVAAAYVDSFGMFRSAVAGAGFDMFTAGHALNFGGTNAGPMGYGNATNTTGHTFTTDGTGDSEIILPAQSVSGTEILDDTIGPTQLDETANYAMTGDFDLGSASNTNINAAYLVYDSVGSQRPTTGGLVLNLDTEVITDTNYYTLASDEITIKISGTYEIEARVGIDAGTLTRDDAYCLIQEDSSGSFTDIRHSTGYSYHRITTAGKGRDTCVTKTFFTAVAEDKIRIEVGRVGTNVVNGLITLASNSELMIKRLGL